jgi:alkyl hydroperoxide reductase subunit AhpF
MANQPSDDNTVIEKMLEGMKEPVTIVVHVQPTKNDVLEEFKSKIDELGDKYELISVKYVQEEGESGDNVKHLVDHFPAFVVLDKDGNDHDIRFYGCPSGNIFNSLISTIHMFSIGDHGLDGDLLDQIKALEETDIQVLVTPNAPSINATIDVTQMMAFISDKIKASVLELIQFPDIAEQYRVLGIPKTIMNESQHYTGPFTLEEGLEIIQKNISDAEG